MVRVERSASLPGFRQRVHPLETPGAALAALRMPSRFPARTLDSCLCSGLRFTGEPTMPSADFCAAVRSPHGSFSPESGTRRRPPEVSSTAFTAHLPNLQPGLAVDTGLRGSGPARPTQTASYSVPVRQVAVLLPRFLQTAPRGHRPCASLALCLHQTWAEDLHLRAVKHARHTRSRGRTKRAHRPLENPKTGFPTAPTGDTPALQDTM